ncbi:diiron oxygenase [Nocardia sp. CNY236]|uniref:diiron oxygenase n=1 Tax=Nocardia sp. CNY236 TaxID=1169152 RepID=UPI00041DFF60
MNPVRRFVLSLAMPLLMRVNGDAILIPSRQFFEKFDVPKDVRKQAYYSADAARYVSEFSNDARALAHEIGLMNPVSKLVWKMARLDGRVSLYRSEPRREAR